MLTDSLGYGCGAAPPRAGIFPARRGGPPKRPADVALRDDLLLRLIGSPDPRQIDGIGGADPLTAKVAILSAASRDDADVDQPFRTIAGSMCAALLPTGPGGGCDRRGGLHAHR